MKNTPLKTKHQQRIEQMMRLFGQEVPSIPTIPSADVRLLRARLILEEAFETVAALGVSVTYEDKYSLITDIDFKTLKLEIDPFYVCNLIDIVDGCVDTSVVTIGILSACGVADERYLEIVDNNNLKKIEGGHKDLLTGKWLKPVGFVGPNIEIKSQIIADTNDCNQ